jgi:hypothetical protein
MKKPLFLILLLASRFSFALDQAPLNEILCSASIFTQNSPIPLLALQPFDFSLSPTETTLRWKRTLEKVTLVQKYQKFYSPYWIAPDALFPFSTTAVEVRTPLSNGNVEFVLSRFPQTGHRIAGLSLQFNVARGFYGAFLLDKVQDGPHKKILAPVELDGEKGFLSVDCFVKD